ncbi:MAG: alpha/beta hydrolase [bacterium]|nr:alpha/beta hydrolase [bacterium]
MKKALLIIIIIFGIGAANGLYPAPTNGKEKAIEVEGRLLQCRVFGKGKPVVVLISGFRAPQTYWDSIVHKIALHSTVVTYDRPGYGKSTLGERPVDGITTAKDLKILLQKLNLPGPYLLVGHSYGGKITRIFASLFPKHIHGIVLVDSTHHDYVDDYKSIMNNVEREKFDRMEAAWSQNPMPATTGPGKENQVLDTTIEQLKKINIQLDVPLVVMTAGNMRNSPFQKKLSKETYDRLKKLLREHPKKHFALSTKARHVIVEGAGHNIHIDKPEAVIKAVVDMVK